VSRILIYSSNEILTNLWSSALSLSHQVKNIETINSEINADAIVIDIKKIDTNDRFFPLFKQHTAKFLLVGENWSETDQINALVHGAAGYCGQSEPPELLLQAVKSILKGDIWIQRHLVPKVIGTLIQMKSAPAIETNTAKSTEATKLLQSLSGRELDVAKMIRSGESNKSIANALYISERTVKAHLSSTFKKLKVEDRLHLALFIKEFY
jgi:DNA-binding NarL/FixJ family response regulator